MKNCQNKPTSKTISEAKRLEYIDALRAVAALSVLFVHMAAYLARQPDAPWLAVQFKNIILQNFDLGLFGVALFFFISGFVVPFSLLERNNLREFWIHRLFRLYPPFWLSLIAVVLTEGFFQQKIFPLSQILSNITMVPQVFGDSPMSGIYWTLFVEIIFYALCSMLYLAGLLDRPIVIAGAVLFLVGITAIPMLMNTIFDTGLPVKYIAFHLSFLFSGTLVRLCITEGREQRYFVLTLILTIQLLLSSVVTGIFIDGPPGFGFFTSHANLMAYGAASVFFMLSIMYKMPVSKMLVRLGGCSYSLYLLHWPVIVVLLAVLPGSTSQISIPLIVFGTAFSLWLAGFSFRFLERPCIRAGKYFGSRVFCHAM